MNKYYKFLIISLSYFLLSTIFDWYSTIIYPDPVAVEENPVSKFILIVFGKTGLLIHDLIGVAIVTLLLFSVSSHFSRDSKIKYSLPVFLVLLSSFRVIIGLTNLGFAPIELTSWLTY